MKKRFEVWVNDGAGARKLCHFPTEYGAERKAEESSSGLHHFFTTGICAAATD